MSRAEAEAMVLGSVSGLVLFVAGRLLWAIRWLLAGLVGRTWLLLWTDDLRWRWSGLVLAAWGRAEFWVLPVLMGAALGAVSLVTLGVAARGCILVAAWPLV